jgi:hypothetical protein
VTAAQLAAAVAAAAAADDFCGNPLCLMAVSAVCTCRCGGEWHGAGRRSDDARRAA